MEADLERIVPTAEKHRLKINLSKSAAIVFTKRAHVVLTGAVAIKVRVKHIHIRALVGMLSLLRDNDLRFRENVSNIEGF